jgi:hypothetical protein
MGCYVLPWAQGVGGSNPLAPIKQLSELGGLKWSAFFHVHMNVHTGTVWVSISLDSNSAPVNSCRNRFSAEYCG